MKLPRICLLAQLVFALAACGSTPTPDIAATVQAAVAATQTAQPTMTSMPTATTATPTPLPTATPRATPTPTSTPAPTTAGCQSAPSLRDLGQLGLRVTKTEVRDRIRGYFTRLGHSEVLSADEHQRLVVVQLTGVITQPWAITLVPTEFAAVFEQVPVELSDNTRTQDFDIRMSSAVGRHDGWAINAEGDRLTVTFFLCDPGPVEIQVAFILPEDVSKFDVRFPALAEGSATIHE